jgi:hypothetical protein
MYVQELECQLRYEARTQIETMLYKMHADQASSAYILELSLDVWTGTGVSITI